MPFFLLFAGIILLVVVIRGSDTTTQFVNLLKSDFSGQDNFFVWVLAFIFLIALGYWKTIRPITDTFLVLIIIVIFIAAYEKHNDLISSFMSQIKQGTS